MYRETFLYRLYQAKPQARLLQAALETCRYWYNQCLAERKHAYEHEQRTVGKYEQLAKVKDIKATNLYARNVHSHVLQTVVQDLDKAFDAFFRRVKNGEKAGYPRFRGRNRWRSFGFKELGNGFKIDGRRLKLSGIGRVAIRWHTTRPPDQNAACQQKSGQMVCQLLLCGRRTAIVNNRRGDRLRCWANGTHYHVYG